MFLRMIDMNSSDVTCVYSTVEYVCKHACCHYVTLIITFDQPLFWKSLIIIVTEPVESELRYCSLSGRFHTELSYLGVLAISWLHLDYKNCCN